MIGCISGVIFANLYTKASKELHFAYDFSDSFYVVLFNTQRNEAKNIA